MAVGTLFGMTTSRSSSAYTDIALASFFKNTLLKYNDNFVLIDNDNAWTKLPNAFTSVVHNEFPKSFAENVNILIRLAHKNNQDLVFLSNDVLLTPDWLPPLENNNAISIPCCNQIFQYKSGLLNLESVYDLERYNNQYEDLCNIVKNHKLSMSIGSFDKLMMPFYAFRLPNEIYSAVGYLDEIFINGGEDLDYRIRALILDIPVAYISQSFVLHFNGKSTWQSDEDIQKTKDRDLHYKTMFTEKWGKDLCHLMTVGQDPNDILKKYNIMHFNPAHHTHADLIKTILAFTNKKEIQ